MNDRQASGSSVTVRHEPVQARAALRIEALLDAAAAVVVDHGIEHLTTALVAERAGASIGTVYRYFPDRVAVLVALAERNLERIRLAIERVLLAEHPSLMATIEAVVDAMVETFRTVPSFRSLRGGEGLDLGPSERPPVAPTFVDDMAAHLRERWEIELDDEQREALELAIGALDALVTYAFLHDPDGDPRYLQLGVQVMRERIVAALPQLAEGA
ncbi:TetR/AcrR family transcriptional regulator [Agrococcus sp. TF02-05]|uniref:TetR/AcrR family transcriptional regulator n=1 Tax=Agrococcus sp. TF02-05 TaxID=2815211 RepID=UPI001AA1713C|nr:TetR/AcrR family transcriptional regulator [Agrococcus sp. TF02-05]MBO1768982.1 TetR/AcrR family transcriptional regulator [Agrococcus sp. TF02-05]